MFQRPRSLTDDEKGAALEPPRSKCCVPAPSVLVFNQAGDIVKAWGGPGDNLGYDWPLQEHGILVDNKGFVWLSGNGKGDSMVLKFTTDGKFVKELGSRGPLTSSTDLTQFGQVGGFDVRSRTANEIYAADGYGNHRVAVLDADTGAIKRIWGAYGKPPTDEDLPKYNPDSPQFGNPVHCIALAQGRAASMSATAPTTASRCSTRTAAYVRQFVFDAKTQGSGSTWGMAFSPLDKKQNYFMLIDGTNNVMETVRRYGRRGRRHLRPPGPRRRRIPLGACRQVRLARQFLYRRGRYRQTPAEMGAGRMT